HEVAQLLRVDREDALPEAERLEDAAERLLVRLRDVLRSPVDGGAVGAVQPPVPVLLAEGVDQRDELVNAPVDLPALALEADPLVHELRHPRRRVAVLSFVAVAEDRAHRLVVAPVAERVLPGLELAGGDALRD